MNPLICHPIFNRMTCYADHPAGEIKALGDDLGRDCMVCTLVDNGNGKILATYKNNGTNNEDWFTWNADVLAPVSGVVTAIYSNPVTNTPGIQTPGRASSIIIQTHDGIFVALAHIREPIINEGATVTQGQPIAKAGNDGWARFPHVHIGAWKDNQPLPIDFDRTLMAAVKENVGELFWFLGTDELPAADKI